jgi:hypothetical protein
LLGLAPGENDTALIEQRVHQRIDSVRAYQMRYPEQATEAMRLLARAFDCLTDPAGKKAYDNALAGGSATATAEPPSAAILEARDQLAWLYDPPPIRGGVEQPSEAPRIDEAGNATVIDSPTVELPPLPPQVELPPAAPPVAPSEPADPVVEAAHGDAARRRLNTKRGLYSRIVLTRTLIRTWTRVGKYLASPKRRLNRPSEATDLIRLLEEIQDLLRQFPPLMGEAGQPGYLVVTLAQLVIVPTFQTMDLKARKALSEDWKRGLKLLTAHRDFLRQEIGQMRRRPMLLQLVRAFNYFPSDSPVAFILLVLALLAINIAFWRTHLYDLTQRLLPTHL